MTDDLVEKISFQNEKIKVKVTYEVGCDSSSGEVTFGMPKGKSRQPYFTKCISKFREKCIK